MFRANTELTLRAGCRQRKLLRPPSSLPFPGCPVTRIAQESLTTPALGSQLYEGDVMDPSCPQAPKLHMALGGHCPPVHKPPGVTGVCSPNGEGYEPALTAKQ